MKTPYRKIMVNVVLATVDKSDINTELRDIIQESFDDISKLFYNADSTICLTDGITLAEVSKGMLHMFFELTTDYGTFPEIINDFNKEYKNILSERTDDLYIFGLYLDLRNVVLESKDECVFNDIFSTYTIDDCVLCYHNKRTGAIMKVEICKPYNSSCITEGDLKILDAYTDQYLSIH